MMDTVVEKSFFPLPALACVLSTVEAFDHVSSFHPHLLQTWSVPARSLCVSNSLVDKKLNAIGTKDALELTGKPANVRAALALKLHQEKLSGLHWEGLARRGKQKQMVFWTSIAVKDPSYPDPPLCINPLIYGDTVSYFVPDTNLM
uniref:Uncharacterized protein n=1 Tax=Physcomitrium patens TaxID=3218 RepID=A0A2K1KUK5_PHYPA|nr:hypothetical protein PHYPA_004469 [Physcomitrium patens]